MVEKTELKKITQIELTVALYMHRLWLDSDDGERLNLSNADLSEANFSGEDLRWANLREANLSGADFYGANLRQADLSGANLTGADFSWADLRNTDLRGADLRGAQFDRATFLVPTQIDDPTIDLIFYLADRYREPEKEASTLER